MNSLTGAALAMLFEFRNPFHKHRWFFKNLRVIDTDTPLGWTITWDCEQCRKCGKTRPKGKK